MKLTKYIVLVDAKPAADSVRWEFSGRFIDTNFRHVIPQVRYTLTLSIPGGHLFTKPQRSVEESVPIGPHGLKYQQKMFYNLLFYLASLNDAR